MSHSLPRKGNEPRQKNPNNERGHSGATKHNDDHNISHKPVFDQAEERISDVEDRSIEEHKENGMKRNKWNFKDLWSHQEYKLHIMRILEAEEEVCEEITAETFSNL